MAASAANAHDYPLVRLTPAGVADMVGQLPEGAGVHLGAEYASGKTPRICCRFWATPARRDHGHAGIRLRHRTLGGGAGTRRDQ